MKLQALYGHFSRSPEGKWIMQPQNAVRLYKFIKDNPVKRVLEFGTGIGLSAAVIALAFRDKGEKEGVIDTLEQSDKCIRIATRMIPDELKQVAKINIIKTGVEVWNTPHIPHLNFSNYDKVPEGDYDVIINDGPSPFKEGEHYVDLSNGTIKRMLLEDKIKPGTLIVYDGRIASFNLLERFFSKCFFLIKPSAGSSEFNVLERRDGPVKIFDSLLEGMTNLNYFNDEKENLHSDNGKTALSTPTSPDKGTEKEV